MISVSVLHEEYCPTIFSLSPKHYDSPFLSQMFIAYFQIMFNVLLAWVELAVDRPDLLKSRTSEAFSTGAIVPEDGQDYLDINKVPQNRCECCNYRVHIINASVRLH